MVKPVEEKIGFSLSKEVAGLIVLAISFFVGAALYSERDGLNWVGSFGTSFSWVLTSLLGYASYEIPLLLLFISLKLIIKRYVSLSTLTVVGLAIFLVSTAAIFSLFGSDPSVMGGMAGAFISGGLMNYIGIAGAFIVLITLVIIAIIAMTGLSFVHTVGAVILFILSLAYGIVKTLFDMIFGKKSEPEQEAEAGKTARKKKKARSEPAIITSSTAPVTEERAPKGGASAKASTKDSGEEVNFLKPTGHYRLPPLSLLSRPSADDGRLDKKFLIENSKILEKKLRDFGVEGEVLEVRPGPVVTMYEFEPAPGIKVGKITNLSNDLALAMKATSIRIVAPIPGKSVVGIEVANTDRLSICFRELLEYPTFQKSHSALSVAIGKEISGTPYVGDLSRMPHLLIAGATGSGKSVFVNSLILSILYKATPEDVRFLMIDPKMLELSAYEGIPHLLTPVITDPKKATGVLRSIVHEMTKRYKLMADLGGKSIETYNSLVKDLKPEERKKEVGEDGAEPLEHVKLPYIVVIIDELSDLMMTSGKEVEECIVRLSQMARAAGIHLVVATQRPSVDVITGLVKTNFPARISFKLPSRTDSRTILDAGGAETLLGSGDMLMLPPGRSELIRLHGPYVSEKEIKGVTDFLKKQGTPTYDMDIAEARSVELTADEEDLGEEFMQRYREAVEMAMDLEMISTSYIQRRFRIGYNTAARIVEKMEMDGIVGPSQGSRPREVLKRS